jgi:hypothetical protein
MKRISILKNLATWSAVLAGVMAFGMACVSHAQTGSMEQDSTRTSGQGSSLSGQSSSDQESGKTDQRDSQPKSKGSASGQSASDQSDSSSSKVCAEQKLSPCEQPAPQQEGFLHKLIRILYGPDTPPGPNPDVDTNISAGGAAGG